ncbi:MAG: hypothetical protein MJ178_10350 [Treponemataceae bacterium]|nr:hypothetical protein [Treponemataceae bacterium]
MQDSEYYSMMRNQYHNNDWEAKLKEKKAREAKTVSTPADGTSSPDSGISTKNYKTTE